MSLGPFELLKLAMDYRLLWQFDKYIWSQNTICAYQVYISVGLGEEASKSPGGVYMYQ